MKLSSTTIGPNCMSRLQNHAMLRDAATEVLIYRVFCWRNMARPHSREFFSWKTDFLGNCSHEGQIHSSGSSSFFAQHLKEESRGLILLGNF